MGETLTTWIGSDATWDFRLRDEDGQPCPYPVGSTLDAAVWRGDREAALFAPAVAWSDDDPLTGLAFASVARSQLSAIDPGTYRMQVGVTAEGLRDIIFDGQLEVRDAPGTDPTLLTYGPADDLYGVTDQLKNLQNPQVDRAAYLEQRSRARDEINRRIVECYWPRAGFIKRRVSGAFDPVYGHDRPDFTLVPPTRDELAAILDAGGLVVDARLREMAAWFAVALVLDRPETAQRQNTYRDEADVLRQRFDAAMHAYKPHVDLGSAGTIEISHGMVVYLPEAP